MVKIASATLKMLKLGTKRRPTEVSRTCANQLETPKCSSVAVVGALISKLAADYDATNVAQVAGGVGGLAGAGALLQGARGKATPSILDLGYQLWNSKDSSISIFDRLAADKTIPKADLKALESLAIKSPMSFKAVLAGVSMPGIGKHTQETLRNTTFNSLATNPGSRIANEVRRGPPVVNMPGIPRVGMPNFNENIPRVGAVLPRKEAPRGSTNQAVEASPLATVKPMVGDVNVYSKPNELTNPYGRMQHVLTGQPSHSAIRGNTGYFETSGDIEKYLTKDRLQTLLRSKKPLDPDAIRQGLETIRQPYSIKQLRRAKAHEILSPASADRTKPTIIEHVFGPLAKNLEMRRIIKNVPLVGPPAQQWLRDLDMLRKGKNCEGGICSTAVTDVLQRADPKIMQGRKPMEITPADFLRRVGKDFDVVGMNVPKGLQSTKQLVLNHLMKAGPWASRAAIAAPLAIGGISLLNKGLRKNEPEPYTLQNLVGKLKEKFAASFAPGIKDPTNYGDPTRDLKPGQLADYTLQKHETTRNPTRPHYDLRIGSPATNLFSWAIPGAEMPEPGQKKLAPQTAVHSYSYGSYTGPIKSRYGRGDVSMADKGKVLIRKTSPNSVHFTVAHSKIPTRYSLINIGGESGGRDWLLVHKAEPKSVVGVGDKPKYKLIEAPDLDDALDQATEVQEKIDGASQVYQVGPEGAVEAYSVNPRTTGEPIRHTERIGLTGVTAPKELKGTTLRGEVYATDPKGKAIPFQELSGLLNSTIAKAVEQRRLKKIQIRNAIFDVIQHKGQDVTSWPLAERSRLAKEIVAQLPKEHFHSPLSATDSKAKAKILADIVAGKNPRTAEGIILHSPEGKLLKHKLRPESRGYVTGTFPGKAGRTGLPGGVTFSEAPGGKERGRVGSGFTLDELKDVIKNLEAYKKRPMRIAHMGKFPSGTLRAPVFSGWETDVKEAQLTSRSKEYPRGKPVDSNSPGFFEEKVAPSVVVNPGVPTSGATTNHITNLYNQLNSSVLAKKIPAVSDAITQGYTGTTNFYARLPSADKLKLDQASSNYFNPNAGKKVNSAELGFGFRDYLQKVLPNMGKAIPYILHNRSREGAQIYKDPNTPTIKSKPVTTSSVQPVVSQPINEGSSMKLAASPLTRSLLKRAADSVTSMSTGGYTLKPEGSGQNTVTDSLNTPILDFNRKPQATQLAGGQTPIKNPAATPGAPPSTVAMPGSGSVPPGEATRIQALKDIKAPAQNGGPIATQETP